MTLLLIATALLLAILVTHVVIDLNNARRDRQFYDELTQLRDAWKGTALASAQQRESTD